MIVAPKRIDTGGTLTRPSLRRPQEQTKSGGTTTAEELANGDDHGNQGEKLPRLQGNDEVVGGFGHVRSLPADFI